MGFKPEIMVSGVTCSNPSNGQSLLWGMRGGGVVCPGVYRPRTTVSFCLRASSLTQGTHFQAMVTAVPWGSLVLSCWGLLGHRASPCQEMGVFLAAGATARGHGPCCISWQELDTLMMEAEMRRLFNTWRAGKNVLTLRQFRDTYLGLEHFGDDDAAREFEMDMHLHDKSRGPRARDEVTYKEFCIMMRRIAAR